VTATKNRRAVGYVRISKDRDDETSTATQEERVRAYCKAHGWQIVEVIVEPGRSAYKASRTSRPGFRRAMGLVASGAANTLVVWKLDRASRNAEDVLSLVRELAEHGAQLASVTESFDTSTPTGKAMFTMVAAIAEMESAQKSERVLAWQEHRRTSGATPTGPRLFGYRRDPEHPNELFIDKAEAKVLRTSAKRVLAGDSLRSIVADLTADGVMSTRGKPIRPHKLRVLLLSPTIAACREVEPGVFVDSDAWKPILDRATWDKVRAVLNDPSRRTTPVGGGAVRRWWLSGIAVCGRGCTRDGQPAALHVNISQKSGPRYYCSECYLSIDVAQTEELVEAALLELLDRKTWRRLRQGQALGPDLSGFEEAMQELTARFVAGDLDGEEMGKLADALRQEVAASPKPPSLPNVDDLRKAWPTFTVEQRRVVLSSATESLTILPWQGGKGFDETRIEWVPVA
jgi:DNA invertase Pin-like site-specific DNA recombinase